jgi:CubicO group peptidase (beta-lactamase class C family)
MIPAFELEEIVREARVRTGVPGVAAGVLSDGETVVAADGVLELGRAEPVLAETPFRIASISKPFTASLALSSMPLDETLRGRLSHTAGLRCESAEPLPEAAQGLFSYSNAGYWAVGEACEARAGVPFERAMVERLLEPLGLADTGYREPLRPARGHLQAGATGHRPVARDAYPAARQASGGLWSTVADLLGFAAHHLGGPGPLPEEVRAAMRQPQSQALGGGYALGWWTHSAAGRAAVAHEGSVAGYQSLLLLVPDKGVAVAVLTNSWRGSGLVRRVVEQLGLGADPPPDLTDGAPPADMAGRYALDGSEATVEVAASGSLRVGEAEIDPVTGERIERGAAIARPLGGDVYGIGGGLLMSHRLDFPRPGIARVGWVALPRDGA